MLSFSLLPDLSCLSLNAFVTKKSGFDCTTKWFDTISAAIFDQVGADAM